MKHRQTWIAAGMALLASLLFAAPASAAPELGVEVVRDPATLNRGDEGVRYQVNVKNTGVDPTSGTLTVAIDLPPGFTLKRASGSGWSCQVALLSCTSSNAVLAGGSYPTLKLDEIWIDDSAPGTATLALTASGGGASTSAVGEDSFTFGPELPFELATVTAIAENEVGTDETQAGGHPYRAAAIFRINQRRGPGFLNSTNKQMVFPIEDMRGGASELPTGVIGNPEAAPAVCPVAELKTGDCPDEAAVGGIKVYFTLVFGQEPDFSPGATDVVYRLPPEKGYPASFGFDTIGPSFIVRAKVRSDGDYGVTAVIPLVPQSPAVFGSEFVFCGFGAKVEHPGGTAFFKGCKKRTDADANEDAFITLGTNCGEGAPTTRFAIDSWQKPGAYGSNELPDLTDPNWSVLDFLSPQNTGCEILTEEWTSNHEPSFSLQPDGHAADSPAAYSARLHIPQEGLLDPDGLATAHLKDTNVTLPEGLTFNPAVGHRLEACSTEQVGFLGAGFPAPSPIRFDTKLPKCPEASKIGTVLARTPVLGEPLHGSVFLAAQNDNPFNSNYAIYLTVEEPEIGVIAKLAGKVTPDPLTGRIKVLFANNPQLPVEDFELDFFGGDRSALANPVTCGSHNVTTALTPWSAADPQNPQPAEIARPSDQIQITSGPGGSACASDPAARPFDIGLEAGSSDPIAGIRSPFKFRVTRPDGSQEIDRLEMSPPEGFVGSLRGIPYCSEAQIRATELRSGKAEQGSSSCPAASQIGTTNVGAGPGANPYYAPGKLYLSGPYKGQKLSVVSVTPAVAGPFDLGNVVVRAALALDPLTARITAITDPLPQVHEGIPLRARDIRIDLDRPGWAMTPTNCEAMSVDVTAYGASGAIARPSSRYQVGGCERLPFKPKLSIRFKGGTRRGAHPALLATLSTRDGDANIARAAVTLPRSAFLDQAHIRTICTRVQFAEDACPKGAIYGYAEATTELLDDPLKGNVILRSSDNKLPDLVGDLKGVADIEAVGRIDSIKGGIRNTFDIVPDAPFDAFTLRMQGGKKGLVINSQNLCAKVNRATVKLVAHNGRHYNFRPKVVATGCGKGKKGKRDGGRRRG